MKHPACSVFRLICPVLLVLLLQACSATPYKHGTLENSALQQRALLQEHGNTRVRASVPSADEAEQILGIPIYKRGIQPVWLEITNSSDDLARFSMVSVDHDYFSPLEVAYMHKKYFSKQGWMDMEKYLYRTAIPRFIAPGQTVSGFVYTNASPGTKTFNVEVFYIDDMDSFTFYIEVPGFTPDHASVKFEELYRTSEIQDVDTDDLRSVLQDTPCCTTNRDGTGQGQPINLVLVARGREILRTLLRAGWSETSYEKDDNYLNNVNYFFNRPPDAVFRKSRGKSTERNELSLWLAPIRTDGKEVWFAHMKHAIGQRYKINEIFFGSALDPDLDDGRNFLLQNLWYSQCLEALAYLDTGITFPVENPTVDFNDNPFFSDGVRAVLWLSGDPVILTETRNLNWDALLSGEGEK